MSQEMNLEPVIRMATSLLPVRAPHWVPLFGSQVMNIAQALAIAMNNTECVEKSRWVSLQRHGS